MSGASVISPTCVSLTEHEQGCGDTAEMWEIILCVRYFLAQPGAKPKL